MKKRNLLLLGLGVLLGLVLLFWCLFLRNDTILGRWETVNGLALEITEEHLILQGISFPYEMERGGSFILDGGPLGPIAGNYRLERGRLFLTVDGAEEIFFRP